MAGISTVCSHACPMTVWSTSDLEGWTARWLSQYETSENSSSSCSFCCQMLLQMAGNKQWLAPSVFFWVPQSALKVLWLGWGWPGRGLRWREYNATHLGCDAPGIFPVQALLVNQQAHELSHSNGWVSVIHLEGSLGGELLPVFVACLLVASHHILSKHRC